jgi:protein involved in polysaccharide export with SLBB domain
MKTPAIIAALVAALLSPSLPAQTAPIKAGDPLQIELKAPAKDATVVNGTYTVSPSGTVKLPHLEREVFAAGLTTTDLARRIEQAYKVNEIYTSPTININVPRPEQMLPHIVTVGGEVGSRGKEVAMRDGLTLYGAIMSAGGFTEFADTKRVKLIRNGVEKIYDLRKNNATGANSVLLKDGDVIHVPPG